MNAINQEYFDHCKTMYNLMIEVFQGINEL